MIGLEEMNKEELLEVVRIKDCKIRELEEEIVLLKDIVLSKLKKEDFRE